MALQAGPAHTEGVRQGAPMTAKQAQQTQQAKKRKHASNEPTIDELAKQALAAFDAITGVL